MIVGMANAGGHDLHQHLALMRRVERDLLYIPFSAQSP
jgi:hypothetical protein